PGGDQRNRGAEGKRWHEARAHLEGRGDDVGADEDQEEVRGRLRLAGTIDGTDGGGVHGAWVSMYLDATLVGRYRINIIMAKQAISVTLDSDNLTWLKGRAGAAGLRSVSELLDQLVTAAREGGRIGPARSVVGTIDVDPDDPLLEGADTVVRGLFETSLRRPLMVKETPPEYGAARRKKPRR